jgi:hypothetical protein
MSFSLPEKFYDEKETCLSVDGVIHTHHLPRIETLNGRKHLREEGTI